MDVPPIDLTDPEVIRDPFTAYGRARESAPLARIQVPGMPAWWVVLRHADARAALGDARLEIKAGSFMRPDAPEEAQPYLRTMSERPGPEHARLRRLVAPAFTPRRAGEHAGRIEAIVEGLLDETEAAAGGGEVDLIPHFTRPLPMDVICAVVGIPDADRPLWRVWGASVAGGRGGEFAAAIPGILDGARQAIARKRAEPGDDMLSDLIAAREADGDRLAEEELVSLVWQLVLSGQTPTNLIANAVCALLSHPAELDRLRADPGLMPSAVEELIRWCGPTLLVIPRYAREEVEVAGRTVREGEAVTVAAVSANRDPRVYTEPERLDVGRDEAAHLGFAHGAHFCPGAHLARVTTRVVLAALLARYPRLALAAKPAELRAPDPGTLRLTALPVTLGR
ncbi:cytochrome P450 family protein [Nonomuraea typhae]|uniref:cytochrome P450 family protein n=1 Tax=Nonomuraea typhae TaxID=2603600 RepID=UPI0012F721E8|nr:cytochrome P450 [Nonomuraea typhae]